MNLAGYTHLLLILTVCLQLLLVHHPYLLLLIEISLLGNFSVTMRLEALHTGPDINALVKLILRYNISLGYQPPSQTP